MVKAAWELLRESGRVLLEAAPEGIDLDEIRAHLMRTSHVRDVHDLHVWTLTSSLPTLSAHVAVDDSCFTDSHAPRLLDELQACQDGTSTSALDLPARTSKPRRARTRHPRMTTDGAPPGLGERPSAGPGELARLRRRGFLLSTPAWRG